MLGTSYKRWNSFNSCNRNRPRAESLVVVVVVVMMMKTVSLI